jgi:hypothetical protein
MKHLENDGELVKLVFLRDGRWQELSVSRKVIASAREIVSLAGSGLPVTSKTAGDLVEYLADFEAANMGHLPCVSTNSKMGWQGKDGDRGFLWGKTHFTEKAEAPEARRSTVRFWCEDEGGNRLADGLKAEGSMAAWKKAVQEVSDFPCVAFTLYASLAAPLLEIVGTPNFIVDLAGNTSCGKTTTLRVAASVWGCPDENTAGSLMATWDSTPTWIERAAATRSSLPMILDETKRCRWKETLPGLIYSIASGQGRGRGSITGTRATVSFRTILLSSGEDKITSFSTDGGTHSRVLELWMRPFGEGDQAATVRQITEAIHVNYGHAGPEMVRFLLANRSRWNEFRKTYADLKSAYITKAGSHPVMGRYAAYLATIEVAAKIAHEALQLPWAYVSPVDALWNLLAEGAQESDRAAEALKSVYSWAQAHEGEFIGRHRTSEGHAIAPSAGWAGKWASGAWESLAFYPPRLTKVLEELGYEAQSIIRTWGDRTWLSTDGDRKDRLQKTMRVEHGDIGKFYAIKKVAVDEICLAEALPNPG